MREASARNRSPEVRISLRREWQLGPQPSPVSAFRRNAALKTPHPLIFVPRVAAETKETHSRQRERERVKSIKSDAMPR